MFIIQSQNNHSWSFDVNKILSLEEKKNYNSKQTASYIFYLA